MQVKALPPSVKILIALLVGASLTGVVHIVEPRLTLIYFIGFVAIILLFLLYLFIAATLKKRQASGFGVQLNAGNTQAPSTLNDPAKRARLDDLRRNFEKGVDRYRTAGKDIYSLPWLLVVGEPGSGKTEAIRHSNVGFPPGLQDELQGVGGTINMNWWFTNRAVILDTAGRLMFEEVEAGATSEWKEFLRLLRKNRPNCPVNGMLLVIPVDTLIKDSTDQIAKKASKIAQQLDVIQRTLDVRFPVYVVITKCDLINGFREFFDTLTDPQLQHQILGWSNPTPLDEPFHPELIDQHLEQVSDQLSKRRLALLRDPIPEKLNGRRTDEVDALYSLPASLLTIAPRLRRYLETIFVSGEWSAKPLFLRGIYFSSAMREGSALDLELAQAIGVSVESLPEGKAWERERAYFLRDLFLEKVFRERGLVTRASNTRQLLRRRRLIWLGSSSIGLLLVLGFSFLGYRSLYTTIGNESAIWQTGANGWNDGQWNPIVTPEFKGATNYTYNGAQLVAVGGHKVPLFEFHRQLRALTAEDIQVPIIFRPMETVITRLNPGRRQAQRNLFEISVIKPLLDATRAKLVADKGAWSPAATQALGVLMRIEGMIHNPDTAFTADDFSAESFFMPLVHYVVPNADVSTVELGKTFEATYLANASDRKKFPPAWMSGGGSLLVNKPIAAGLSRFFAQAQADQKGLDQGMDLIRGIRGELREFRKAEDELAHLTASTNESGELAKAGVPIVNRISDAQGSVQLALKKLSASGLIDPDFASLGEAYKTLADKSKSATEGSFKALQSEINRFPVADAKKSSDYTLPAEITRLLRSNLQDLRDRVESSFTAKEDQEIQTLDEMYVVKGTDGIRLFDTRANLYKRSIAPAPDALASPPLIGSLDRRLEAVHTGVRATDDRVKTLTGRDAPRAQATAHSLLAAGELITLGQLFSGYNQEFETLMTQQAKFPLIATKDLKSPGLATAAVKPLAATIKAANKDLASPAIATLPSQVRANIDTLPSRIASVGTILDAISPNADDQPATVKVTLIGYADQRKLMAQALNTDEFAPHFAGFIWRTLRIGGNRLRTEAASTSEVAKFPVATNAFSIDFYRGVDDANPDRSFTINTDWAIMRLVQQSYAQRQGNGKDWQIMLPIKDETGKERELFLLLQFDKPLPEISDWPTLAKLVNSKSELSR